MPWYNVEIKGGKGVGKSSLVRRFLVRESGVYRRGLTHDQFIWEKASFPCLHIDKPNRCCDYGLIVWDCNPKTVNTPNIEVHEVRAVVVVYDITDSSSFDEAKDHVQKLSQKRSRSLVVGLVGSKADLLMHRKIKYEDGQLFAKDYSILFMEVSAFTGMNVDNLFSKIGLMIQSRGIKFERPLGRHGLIVDELDRREWKEARPEEERKRKVQQMDLSYQGMPITLRWQFSFILLSKLDLSHNELHKTPEAIGSLRSLTHLFLNDNYLSSLQPEIIRRLVKLEELDLRNNKLNDFSLDITDLSRLQRLSVQGNPLRNDETRKLMMLAHEKRWIDIAVITPELKRTAITSSEVEQKAAVPNEIRLQGQHTMLMYQKALRDGYVNVYRGRIFLIGQDRAGKTSLKKSLLRVPFDPKEESTEGIDPSRCDIDVNRVQNWHVDSKNTILSDVSEQISRSLAVELLLPPSRKGSSETESMAPDVFYVKPRKHGPVSNLSKRNPV